MATRSVRSLLLYLLAAAVLISSCNLPQATQSTPPETATPVPDLDPSPIPPTPTNVADDTDTATPVATVSPSPPPTATPVPTTVPTLVPTAAPTAVPTLVPSLVPTAPPSSGSGSYSGTVYEDDNSNGAYNIGEGKIQGVTVRLGPGMCPSTGYATSVTDSNGKYYFNNVPNGVYCLSTNVTPSCGTFSAATTPQQKTLDFGSYFEIGLLSFGFAAFVC